MERHTGDTNNTGANSTGDVGSQTLNSTFNNTGKVKARDIIISTGLNEQAVEKMLKGLTDRLVKEMSAIDKNAEKATGSIKELVENEVIGRLCAIEERQAATEKDVIKAIKEEFSALQKDENIRNLIDDVMAQLRGQIADNRSFLESIQALCEQSAQNANRQYEQFRAWQEKRAQIYRKQLHEAAHEQNIKTGLVLRYAQQILEIIPNDVLANFYIFVSEHESESSAVNAYLYRLDVDAQEGETICEMLDYLIEPLEPRMKDALRYLADRAFQQRKFNRGKYEHYITAIEEGKSFDPLERWDLFIAYSSKDRQEVEKLVRELESQEIHCFVAYRDLPHGRGAGGENYWAMLKTAMGNSRGIVFVSTPNSRSMTCDAIQREDKTIDNGMGELPYFEATFGKDAKIRIEYRPGSDSNVSMTRSIERFLKRFFGDVDYCQTPAKVADEASRFLFPALYTQDETSTDPQPELKPKPVVVSKPEPEPASCSAVASEFKREPQPVVPVPVTERSVPVKYSDAMENPLPESEDETFAEHFDVHAPGEPARLLLTADGKLRCVEERKLKNFPQTIGPTLKRGGIVMEETSILSNADALVISDRGICYHVAMKDCMRKWSDVGLKLSDIADAAKDEKPIAIFSETEKGVLLFVTERGGIMGRNIEDIAAGKGDAVKMEEGDRLVAVERLEPDERTLCFVTRGGMCLNMKMDEIPVRKIAATCVKGMGVKKGDAVLWASQLEDYGELVLATSGGRFKRVIVSQIDPLNRGASGVRVADMREDKIIFADYVTEPYDLAVFTEEGSVEKLSTEDIPIDATYTRGRPLKGVTWIATEIFPIKYIGTDSPDMDIQQKPSLASTYPTLKNYDKTEFEIKGTVLKKYNGKNTEVKIPFGVTEIGDMAFGGCIILKSIMIPDSVTSIGHFAFIGCSLLKSIVIPDSVTSIGNWSFNGCRSLASIVIPDSVTSIGDGAFSCCDSLESIEVLQGNPVYHSAGNCLIETKSKTLVAGCKASIIPKDGSVTSIGEEAFYGCSSLTSIVIPNSVTSIGEEAFDFCDSLEGIKVLQGNPVYHSAGNCLIETKSKTLVAGCKSSIIPKDGSVTSIGDWSFNGCSSLTSIVIPDSVTTIGSWAFMYVNSLTSIVIPNSVTTIGYKAFDGCSSLTIYCEAAEQPSGWNSEWNPDNRPVVWGYKK